MVNISEAVWLQDGTHIRQADGGRIIGFFGDIDDARITATAVNAHRALADAAHDTLAFLNRIEQGDLDGVMWAELRSMVRKALALAGEKVETERP